MYSLHRASHNLTTTSRLLHRLIALPSPCRTFSLTTLRTANNSTTATSSSTPSSTSETAQQTLSNGFPAMAPAKTPSIPRPSSSVLLISPSNQVLLLQRVKQSSSFPSAHVFPGGNVSAAHDGVVPDPSSPDRHVDSEVYRMCAVRETFEESGILLARNNGFGRLLEVPEEQRQEGRRAVHSNSTTFPKWLAQKGGRADVEGLIPFTRWVTPTNVPKRFTTQMYIYFLPTLSATSIEEVEGGEGGEEVRIPNPTTDGGLEHTTARFLPASVWLRLAQEGRIILFPPQFYLLHQVAQHLDNLASPTDYASLSRDALSRDELERRRKNLAAFVKTGSPPWTEKCISPIVVPTREGGKREDGRSMLGLDKPGPELKGSGRAGIKEECVLVGFRKEGPRQLAVVKREEALAAKM